MRWFKFECFVQSKLLNEGLRFVYKSESGATWNRIVDPDFKYVKSEEYSVLTSCALCLANRVS